MRIFLFPSCYVRKSYEYCVLLTYSLNIFCFWKMRVALLQPTVQQQHIMNGGLFIQSLQTVSSFSLCNNQVSFACDDSERYGLKVHSTKVITWLKRPKPHLKVGTHFRSKMNILYHIGRWTTFAVEITIIWSEISHFQSKVLLDLQIFLFYVIALIFLYSGRSFFNGLLLTWILLWNLSFLTFFLQRH
jgi:hypothetical protein